MKTHLNICLIFISLLAYGASSVFSIDSSYKSTNKLVEKCCCSTEKHKNSENTCTCCSDSKNKEENSDSNPGCEKNSCHCSLSLHFVFSYFSNFESFIFVNHNEKAFFSFKTLSPQTVFLATWQPPKLG